MKHDTTSVRMRSGDHLGDAKIVEKGHIALSNLTFLLIAIDRNGFLRMKDLQKVASDFFLPMDLKNDLSKFSDDSTPFSFFDFERP